MEWAEKRIKTDEDAIVNNRHNLTIVNTAGSDANVSAQRALNMVRKAKGASEQSPEQIATEIESTQEAANQAAFDASQDASELKDTEKNLATSQGQVKSLSEENQKLEKERVIESEYKMARETFNQEEAEVYREGDKILIRLKGLSFPKNKAKILPNNYSLLDKVHKVLLAKGAAKVAIEGHTDSTGEKAINDKLSVSRAEAVKDCFITNKFINSEKLSSTGLGDSKPIATNKTKSGRAQNRRVDIIISEE